MAEIDVGTKCSAKGATREEETSAGYGFTTPDLSPSPAPPAQGGLNIVISAEEEVPCLGAAQI